jgi:hypothetical protein
MRRVREHLRRIGEFLRRVEEFLRRIGGAYRGLGDALRLFFRRNPLFSRSIESRDHSLRATVFSRALNAPIQTISPERSA